MGYSYLGEINNQSICIKYSSIPQTGGSTKLPPSVSMNSFNNSNNNSSPAPPVPPRPSSFVNMNPSDILSIEQTYVHVNNHPHSANSMSPTNHGYNTTQRAYQTQISHVYNPLQGVPFEINPVYSANDTAKNKENFPVNAELNSCFKYNLC
jgi:hypothetical protein